MSQIPRGCYKAAVTVGKISKPSGKSRTLGVSNGPIQFKSARKIRPLLESQKLGECSLARARKIFATARMLGFSLKFLYGKTEKH